MKNILYMAAMALAAVLLQSCADTEPNAPQGGDDLVAVELIATGESVQVSRAADMLYAIKNAAIVVFDMSDNLMQRKYINYGSKERVYLRRGASYKIFAVANLTDDNCPGGDAGAYLDDVNSPADLAGKFLLAASSTPDNVIMCSELKTVAVSSPITLPATVEIPMWRVQSKIDLNIYNKTDGSGNVTSGVDLQSYYTNNLPQGSYLVERPAADYQTAGYGRTSLTDFTSYANEGSYRKYSVEIFTFENRRGSVGGVTDVHKRKELAPEFALEIGILGYVKDGGVDRVLNTFVLPGKGRQPEGNTPDDITNFDVDRNCIYHINVIIDGVDNVTIDSRRQYLELFVCGELESPGDGTWGDH